MSEDQTPAEAAGPVPLFYTAPEPLSAVAHGAWRLGEGDFAFAAETPFVPVVTGEIAQAMHSYPIVFSAGDAHPIAVMGVERENLFVTGGAWAADAYVPAYVRRYPFGFIPTINPEGFALAIDVAAGRVRKDGGEGVALFDGAEPSELTRQALAFCDAFQAQAAATRAFADALVAAELLVDRRADVQLPDGRALGLDGFRIADIEKLSQLPDEMVIEWHRNGWLALVHYHLASLDRFPALLARRAGRPAVVETSQARGEGHTTHSEEG
ncbi:peptidase [Sphingomonas koreensis]|uniref:SapC family protein n=1 Tax=Sphingomonas koreensis TaxID=93064 RepID=UPI0008328C4C|nr:SapC family protein [Sphingomonas koreensis]PJI89679.1 SapC protein [Sphingomonas koreensis]RSU61801.1 peptidase [Sphingomonas koreensis]RSU70456.1 peptidase [Sphingomonas koreensis]